MKSFVIVFFFFSSRRRHTRCGRDWSSDVCSSDLDHRLFVDALALLLGHDERLEVIGTASDGPTAIDLVVDGRAEVAVIDVRMPEVDGIETAKRLRKRSPETRVILVTGLDDPLVAEK